MKSYLDIGNWNRKDHFHFFSSFDEPFFGVSLDVDVTNLYRYAKDERESFYMLYNHKALVAANSIENFRYRKEEDKVAIYDTVGGSATVLREDKTFGFSYTPYASDFQEWKEVASQEFERVRQNEGLEIDVAPENVIHLSSLPWIQFKGLSHARSFTYRHSRPMFSFGKLHEKDGKKYLPMSIHVHHGLMDGYHVGLFVERYQQLLDNPTQTLV